MSVCLYFRCTYPACKAHLFKYRCIVIDACLSLLYCAIVIVNVIEHKACVLVFSTTFV
jgi:hypothetical protein